MSLLSLIAALALEQIRPLDNRNPLWRWLIRYANAIQRRFDAGERHHGIIAWCVVVLPVLAAVGAVYALLYWINPILGWACNVAALYLTMGFRQFSHAFTAIFEALGAGDLPQARAALSRWRGETLSELDEGEVSRLAIEEGLLGSHRHVFGVIVWFLLLPGPLGAVLYRLATMLNNKWGTRAAEAQPDLFGDFAAQAFQWMDWAPVRLTAIVFAIVGNFEDAIYCWRSQATTWNPLDQGILLSSGAGALGVKLGGPLRQYGTIRARPELGMGEEADPACLQSAVGLIWRAVVLWLMLIGLVTVASWLG